jgi:hypothetical protein
MSDRTAARTVLRDNPVRLSELLDRHATDEVLSPQLRPLLHANHPFTALASITPDRSRVGITPDASADRPRGSDFNRRRRVSLQAAPTSEACSSAGKVVACQGRARVVIPLRSGTDVLDKLLIL